MFYIIYFIAGHYIADFIWQTDHMARNKSTNNLVLFSHVIVYSIIMLIFAFCVCTFKQSVVIFVTMIVSHFIIDWCTSKLTKHYYLKNDNHNFFVVIGADQLIHTTIIIVLLNILGLY